MNSVDSVGGTGSLTQADYIREMEEILDIVGEDQITGYQLRDIFDDNKVMATIKRKLVDKVA